MCYTASNVGAGIYPRGMAQLPEDQESLKAVRDAGWLLEHHAIRVLDAAEMHPRSGWAYQDPDDPTTSRELDVWSYRQLLHHEEAKVYVTARFLVECKQSSTPYVGIGHELPEWRFRDNPTEHVMPRSDFQPEPDADGAIVMQGAWQHLGFRDLARQHGETNFRVTQLTRLDRKGGAWAASNAGIFTSLVYPLAKALRASQERPSRARPTPNHPDARPRGEWLDFALHFPVVLISCPLYVVDATDAEPTVQQKPWATTVRQLKSKNTEGTFEFDIVTEGAFEDYVEQRLAFATSLAELVESDPLKFTGETRMPT